MSTQYKNFTQVPNNILIWDITFETQAIPFENAMDELLYIKLMAYAMNKQSNEFELSRAMVAKWLHTTRTTADKAIARLNELGVIKTEAIREVGSKNFKSLQWTVTPFIYETKEVEEEKEVAKKLDNPSKEIKQPLAKKLDNPSKEIKQFFNTDNTDLNKLNTNTSFSIDIESELSDLAYRVFGERMTPTIKSNIISIYKKHCKDNKFNLEMYENILEEVSQQTNITSFYNYLLASVENELAGKPKPTKKDFTSSKQKKVVRKEIAPKWLDKQKENDEKYKKENEEAESDPTWLEEKAKMKAELMQLDQDLKQGGM